MVFTLVTKASQSTAAAGVPFEPWALSLSQKYGKQVSTARKALEDQYRPLFEQIVKRLNFQLPPKGKPDGYLKQWELKRVREAKGDRLSISYRVQFKRKLDALAVPTSGSVGFRELDVSRQGKNIKNKGTTKRARRKRSFSGTKSYEDLFDIITAGVSGGKIIRPKKAKALFVQLRAGEGRNVRFVQRQSPKEVSLTGGKAVTGRGVSRLPASRARLKKIFGTTNPTPNVRRFSKRVIGGTSRLLSNNDRRSTFEFKSEASGRLGGGGRGVVGDKVADRSARAGASIRLNFLLQSVVQGRIEANPALPNARKAGLRLMDRMRREYTKDLMELQERLAPTRKN